MSRSVAMPAALCAVAAAPAFLLPSHGTAGQLQQRNGAQFLVTASPAAVDSAAPGVALGLGAAAGLAAAGFAAGRSRRGKKFAAGPAAESYMRELMVACRAQGQDVPEISQMDKMIADLDQGAKNAVASAAAAVLCFGFAVDGAEAYPIYAQQNYPNPTNDSGAIACSNCHLAKKKIDVRTPDQVLPDTIFKIEIDVPAKYAKRRQPGADGQPAPLNIGAIAILPKGWNLAPRERLPKPLKKMMKGLSWAPYSKAFPNILVAGPVPGETYEKMVLPILAPNPRTEAYNLYTAFGVHTFAFGGNRGRGQIYPEGNSSNNTQYFASVSGKVASVNGTTVTYTKTDGSTEVQEVGVGAQIVLDIGEEVTKGEPITTNPNVGGFGQEELDINLLDLNRMTGYASFAFSIYVTCLLFVLKKKQFEKVQLAEGF